jgi:multisubunit Na+/H+ antiporter MnhB subunit
MVWVWMFIEHSVGLHSTHIDKHPFITVFIMVPTLLIFILMMRDKRKNRLSGSMNYLDAFVSGLILTTFITLMAPLSQWVISTFITPDYFEHAIQYTLKKNMMSEIVAREYFKLSNYIKQSVMGALITGIITSVIVSLFLNNAGKTKKLPDHF